MRAARWALDWGSCDGQLSVGLKWVGKWGHREVTGPESYLMTVNIYY